jgi:hypothetical protein
MYLQLNLTDALSQVDSQGIDSNKWIESACSTIFDCGRGDYTQLVELFGMLLVVPWLHGAISVQFHCDFELVGRTFRTFVFGSGDHDLKTIYNKSIPKDEPLGLQIYVDLLSSPTNISKK